MYNLIRIERLITKEDAPFKVYDGQRFNDMVSSIRALGIINPILVRPAQGKDGFFEVMSGNSRVACGIAVGLTEIPSIIMEVDDDTAAMISMESNVMQRALTDLLPSQRAKVLAYYYSLIKRQGRRTDLEKRISDYNLTYSDYPEPPFTRTGHRIKSREDIATAYGLSSRNVGRYLRINKLIDPLKEKLDNNDLGFTAAVEISYLADIQQNVINDVLNEKGSKITVERAIRIRKMANCKSNSERKIINMENVERVLFGEKTAERLKVRKGGTARREGIGDIKELARREYPEYFDTDRVFSEKEFRLKELLEFYYKLKNALCQVCILFKPDMTDRTLLSRAYLGAMDHYSRMRFG
jgi:ParB family chromosome partitioning protein